MCCTVAQKCSYTYVLQFSFFFFANDELSMNVFFYSSKIKLQDDEMNQEFSCKMFWPLVKPALTHMWHSCRIISWFGALQTQKKNNISYDVTARIASLPAVMVSHCIHSPNSSFSWVWSEQVKHCIYSLHTFMLGVKYTYYLSNQTKIPYLDF